MDQAESSPSPEPGQPAPDQPGRPARPARPDPRPDQHAEHEVPALRLEHPVVAGYDGSASSRNALAYAAGLSLRLARPLLIVYVCSSGVYCEPLTGQVVGVPRDANALAYAPGLSLRLARPLLIVYVCSSGVYCEPLTGQVVGVPRDADALERWLLAELDQVTGQADVDVHVRTRRGSPA